jgi:hypothetical protein
LNQDEQIKEAAEMVRLRCLLVRCMMQLKPIANVAHGRQRDELNLLLADIAAGIPGVSDAPRG